MEVQEIPAWTQINDPDEYYKAREKAYKEFFGQSWSAIIDIYGIEDKTPEEAVEILCDEGVLDYCDYCQTYYLINCNYGVYRCPYCHHKGNYSD